MRWSQVSDASIRVTIIKRRKGAKPVTINIPIHPTLADHLSGWRDASDYVLLDEAGDPWTTGSLTYGICYRCKTNNMCDEDGEPLSLHGLRKLAVVSLAEAGCTPHEIAAITGHATLAMIELYTRAVNRDQLAVAAMQRVVDADKRDLTKTDKHPKK